MEKVVFGSLRRLILVWVILVGFGCAVPRQPETEHTNTSSALDKPYVILVSIDGYRFDYTDRYQPPMISQIIKKGVAAKAIVPVYPSKTFTNHLSIATGLYAENHGIVANNFYDPNRKEVFKLSNRQNVSDGTWYGGTPLWVAAEKQGMLAANYFWPGSEAEIQNTRPSYFYPYDEKTPNEKRVDQIKAWLELPAEKRPHFMTLYFSDVDSAGHHFGPESPQVKEAVLKVDSAIARLFENLKAVKLPVNVIILSDHGMQALDPTKIEYLDDYADLTGARVMGDGLQISIYTENEKVRSRVMNDLKTKAQHFKIYKREELPAKYHYSKNPRCGDLVIVTNSPYSVAIKKGPEAHSKMNVGGHGYDPDTTPLMKGIFYAIGPQIKEGVKVEAFRNIHVYPFILKILGLSPLTPIDGDASVLSPVLK